MEVSMADKTNVAVLLLVTLALCGFSVSHAEETVIWHMNELGRFDGTDEAYAIVGGRVTVNLASESALCPTGLGHLASGMETVREIAIQYEAPEAGDYWLHVTWHPGGSGKEQFEVACNGQVIGKTELVDGEERPYQEIEAVFKVPHEKGANELLVRRLSGDGLHFEQMALTTSSARPGRGPSPRLKFSAVEAYSEEIAEAGIMIDGEHVRLFAPKKREKEAEIIMDCLRRGYEELYKIVGVHTRYKIVVYHFPDGSEHAWGGTSASSCTIWYSYKNLALEDQAEWKRHKVPHVSGYIEEMTHNFVHASGAEFGWEMVGWSIGSKVSAVVAANRTHERHVKQTRITQAKTYKLYKGLGYVLPKHIPPNQADRIHAYLLWECEKKYGGNFWSDFFSEVRKERKRLNEARRLEGSDAIRDERYRITVECFDRLPGLEFKKLLSENRISTTKAGQSLHPTEPGWDRKFE